MPNTWIVYLPDYLETGQITEMPGRARRLADHFGAIVAALTLHTPKEGASTRVKCRRRPGRLPCTGFIQAIISEEARIRWLCPSCGDNGLISGWQGTPWDMRRSGLGH